MSVDLHSGGESASASKKRNGRWKRSAQVCTNCRQAKLRCDYLERFPQPCTRCASSSDSRPCHVDPAYKRVNTRRTTPFSPSASVPVEDNPSTSSTTPPTIYSTGIIEGDTSATTSVANVTIGASLPRIAPRPPPAPSHMSAGVKTLGNVCMTDEEVHACFQEFFQFYHPFCQILPGPVEPHATFARSELLFWAIVSVGCRPRPDHPLVRARSPELTFDLNDGVKQLIAALMLNSKHSVAQIQALLILCQWPFTTTQKGSITTSWKYSGLAIQLGLLLGLHRPHFAAEFSGPLFAAEPIDLAERSRAWVQCYYIHQALATMMGLPSCLTDDWVTSTVAQSRECNVEWFRSFHPDISKLLRIQRFSQRLSTVLGNDAHSQSGQYDATVAPALLSLLNAELADIERGLAPMSPVVSVSFLNAKLQLHTYAFQSDIVRASPQDLLACYSTSMRAIGILHELTLSRDTAALFWPQSVYQTFVIATLSLVKLASIQALHPQKVPINRDVVLREVRTAYAIVTSRSVTKDDGADRVGKLIHFLAKKLAGAAPPDPSEPTFTFRSRMSLGNLLFDAHYQMKRHNGEPWLKDGPVVDSQHEDRMRAHREHIEREETAARVLAGMDGLTAQGPGQGHQDDGSPASVMYDPDALMNTFEDFAFMSEMSTCGVEGLSAENWADMVSGTTFGDLQALWKPDDPNGVLPS